MQFLKDFLRNLALLLIIGVVLFIVSPQIMRQVLDLYGALFGPLAIIILFAMALPKKRRRGRD